VRSETDLAHIDLRLWVMCVGFGTPALIRSGLNFGHDGPVNQVSVARDRLKSLTEIEATASDGAPSIQDGSVLDHRALVASLERYSGR
jgi:hypothetical protein